MLRAIGWMLYRISGFQRNRQDAAALRRPRVPRVGGSNDWHLPTLPHDNFKCRCLLSHFSGHKQIHEDTNPCLVRFLVGINHRSADVKSVLFGTVVALEVFAGEFAEREKYEGLAR